MMRNVKNGDCPSSYYIKNTRYHPKWKCWISFYLQNGVNLIELQYYTSRKKKNWNCPTSRTKSEENQQLSVGETPASPKPAAPAIYSLHGSRYQGHSSILHGKSVHTLGSFFSMTSQATDSSWTNLKYLTCNGKSRCIFRINLIKKRNEKAISNRHWSILLLPQLYHLNFHYLMLNTSTAFLTIT